MTPSPKTIQIYLPGGDPRGIRVAELTTRIVQVIEVPRSLLPTFLAMPESTQVAVYFLVGESDDGTERRVYVGQSGDLPTRLKDHNKAKPFWQRALVMVSRTHSLTQTHALFLEWHSLQAIRAAGFCAVSWHEPVLEQADIDARAEGYWEGYVHNCMSVNLVCER